MEEQELITTTFVKLDLLDILKLIFGRALKIDVKITIPVEKPIERYNASSQMTIVKTSSHFIKQDLPKYGYSPKL